MSQTSWPEPTSVATAAKAIGKSSTRVCAKLALEPRLQAAAAEQPAAGKGYVQEAEHASTGQRASEAFELVELAGGKATSDHRADRGAGDNVRHDALADEFANDADMRPSACGAGAEGQSNLGLRTRSRPLGRVG